MKTQLMSIGQFLLVTLLLTALPVPAQQTNFTDTQAYKVAAVIDGDTVKLMIDGKLTTVRLIGIDTPETVHPNKPVEPYGKRASEFLQNMLSGGSVYLEFGEERTDKYDRTLAYLYRAPDGLFVNLEIVRQGYGRAYTKYPFKYEDLFTKWDSTAKERSRGLWRLLGSEKDKPHPTPPDGLSKPAAVSGGVTVYVTKSGGKYHQEGCRYLSRSKKAISLNKASSRYAPCKVCSPPVSPSYKPSKKRSSSSSTRCQATTKKGTQCKRKAKQGSSYCWQHAG